VTKEEIRVRCGLSIGTNIFKIDIRRSARMIEANPFIKEACITRRLPDAIDINIKERSQVAYIKLFGKKYGLDDEGVILPLLDEEFNFPVVTGITLPKFTVGEKLDLAGVKSALNILKNIKETKLDEYIDIAEINVTKPAQAVLYTGKDKTEIRLGNFPIRNQFGSLKLILVDLNGKEASAEYIDLRFGEKIVVKERKK
jgi:cell division protein FtsQ